jgi:hypothetical protein
LPLDIGANQLYLTWFKPHKITINTEHLHDLHKLCLCAISKSIVLCWILRYVCNFLQNKAIYHNVLILVELLAVWQSRICPKGHGQNFISGFTCQINTLEAYNTFSYKFAILP